MVVHNFPNDDIDDGQGTQEGCWVDDAETRGTPEAREEVRGDLNRGKSTWLEAVDQPKQLVSRRNMRCRERTSS